MSTRVQRRNRLFNALLVAAILAIVAGSILYYQSTRVASGARSPELGQTTTSQAWTVDLVSGTVRAVRNATGTPLVKGALPREGDRIETGAGSSVALINEQGSLIMLGERSQATLSKEASLTLISGRLYKSAPAPAAYEVFKNAQGKRETRALSAHDISDDDIASLTRLIATNPSFKSPLSAQELTAVTQERTEQKAATSAAQKRAIAALKKQGMEGTKSASSGIIGLDGRTLGAGGAQASTSAGGSSGSAGSGSASGASSGSGGSANLSLVTVSIDCKALLSNLDKLESGKRAYVPASGSIVAPTQVAIASGDTAMDVLKRVCKARGVHLEYSWTPAYKSNYIEGINHLYEFDAGSGSGWIYKVNGWSPNYGVSRAVLKKGDRVTFSYTCHYGDDL